MDQQEGIVISGISGRYPECNNMEELMDALFKGVDLVTDDDPKHPRRFPRGVMGIPPRSAKIPEVDRFDNDFFGMPDQQAEFTDPRHRILCETVFECILDAGYNPQELRGSNTGVYVGIALHNNPQKVRQREESRGYTVLGLHGGTASHFISHYFDFKGKSYILDTACSSSMYCFVNAVEDIRNDRIDAAIVASAQILYHPHETSEFNKLNMLAEDGKCKVFSTLRDGYVRGETVASLLLQKSSVSRRVYATVVGALCNADGYKIEGITYPSSEMQLKLMEDIYSKQSLSADDVRYVEAHGTGTPAGDLEELKSIVAMFCKNRNTPLPVGAVKSNMGHSEVAAGMCSISKVIIAMETGIIPANINFDPMDVELPGIKEGKIKIVCKNLPWNVGITSLNCFGFGGANSHIILKPNSKTKSRNVKALKNRLVQVSGRTEEAVNYFLDAIDEAKNRDDEDFFALVDEVHKINVDGYLFRGYTVLGGKRNREISRCTGKRPIWFIYSGLGSEWLGMGRDLMRHEIFKNTIKRCADALRPYKVNLEESLSKPSQNTLNNPKNCFSAIAAVQIAMTDMLKTLGIIPDGYAGHGLGEVGCAYADGQTTPEEAVLLAYAQAYAIQSIKLPPGAMINVNLSEESCRKVLPVDLSIACRNGRDTVSVSGPEKSVGVFMAKLKAQGIIVDKIDSKGVAFQTRQVQEAASHLYDFIRKILKTPKQRSLRWISTSLGVERYDTWAQYNCAEYYRNAFCNPILFDDVYKYIPKDAIVLEISPDGVLQDILRKELGPSATVLALADKNSQDNEKLFLLTIGKIYLAGGQPNLKNLYTNVSYPVSRGTKMLSPLVKWDHNKSWFTPIWTYEDYFGQIIRVNISNDQFSYLTGYNIDERILMPTSALLELVWRTLSHIQLKDFKQFPVVIENVDFKRSVELLPNKETQFLINVMKQSGHFEIFEGDSVVAIGTIYTLNDINSAYRNARYPKIDSKDSQRLTTEDVYKRCRVRGHLYEGLFRGITESNVQGSHGKIKWQGNFSVFFDAMTHLALIYDKERDLLLPNFIEKVVIDPQKHSKLVSEGQDLPIYFNQNVNVIRSGGVEISGLSLAKSQRGNLQQAVLLEGLEFLPFVASVTENDISNTLLLAVKICLQNTTGPLKVCEFEDECELSSKTKKILTQLRIQAEYFTCKNNNEGNMFDFVVFTEKLFKETEVKNINSYLNKNSMIIYQGNVNKLLAEGLNIVYEANNGIYLLNANKYLSSKCSVIHIGNSDFKWMEQITALAQTDPEQVVYLVSQDKHANNLVGLVESLLKEPSTLQIKYVFIHDDKAPEFCLDNDFYHKQLTKNLRVNVFKDNKWGCYINLPLKHVQQKTVENAIATIRSIGDLSTLCWVENSTKNTRSEPDSENILIHYTSLNVNDIAIASGKLLSEQNDDLTSPDISFGLEYSGITNSGKRVMGIVGSQGLSTEVQSNPEFTWEVPKKWSLEEAATIPIAYATSYYALVIKGKMDSGESVLIHSSTDSLGLAAISIALSMDCEVFTTVESQEKREYLKKLYPQLKDKNIGIKIK